MLQIKCFYKFKFKLLFKLFYPEDAAHKTYFVQYYL